MAFVAALEDKISLIRGPMPPRDKGEISLWAMSRNNYPELN